MLNLNCLTTSKSWHNSGRIYRTLYDPLLVHATDKNLT